MTALFMGELYYDRPLYARCRYRPPHNQFAG